MARGLAPFLGQFIGPCPANQPLGQLRPMFGRGAIKLLGQGINDPVDLFPVNAGDRNRKASGTMARSDDGAAAKGRGSHQPQAEIGGPRQ